MSAPHPPFPPLTTALIDSCLLLQSPRLSSFVELPQLVRYWLVRTLGRPHLWGRPLRIRLRVVVNLSRSIPQRLDCRLPPPTWRSHRVPELCSYPSLSALTCALIIDVCASFPRPLQEAGQAVTNAAIESELELTSLTGDSDAPPALLMDAKFGFAFRGHLVPGTSDQFIQYTPSPGASSPSFATFLS